MTTIATYAKGITISSIDGKTMITVNDKSFPTSEETFKKYFTLDWEKGGPNKPNSISLGVNVNCNQMLNSIKHSIKPNSFMQWLHNEKIYLAADELGICTTKTIGYLTNIHPCIIHCLTTKANITDTLNTSMINADNAVLLNPPLKDRIKADKAAGDETTIFCPPFKIFQTTIGVTNGKT